jgi:hypothetical protein
MNEHLRDRILRKLDTLSDERGYQVLDYVEFLESRYAERQSPANAFTRFTEAVEDRLRAGKVSAGAIAETMGLMNRAAGVLNSALAAGRSVASDIVDAATSATQTGTAASTTRPTDQAGTKPPEPGASSPGSGWAAPPTGHGASQQPPAAGPESGEERL